MNRVQTRSGRNSIIRGWLWSSQKARGLARKSSALLLTFYLVVRNKWTTRKLSGEENALISLTTYGVRFETVHLVIESIARGKVRPRNIVLWLDNSAHLESPTPGLRRLVSRGLVIRGCENLGPHKKYFPSLDMVNQGDFDRLITVDDDALYPKDWLDELMAAARVSPTAVIAYRARRVSFSGGDFAAWREWKLVNGTAASILNLGIGEAGISYPREVVNELKSRGKRFLDVAPKADDIWLHAAAVNAGVPTRQVRIRALHPLIIPGSQRTALAHSNIDGGANDVQIKATYSAAEVRALHGAINELQS